MSQFTFYEPVFVSVRGTRLRGRRRLGTPDRSTRAQSISGCPTNRKNQGFGDEDLPDARATSWFVSGTWLLTGDRKDAADRTAASALSRRRGRGRNCRPAPSVLSCARLRPGTRAVSKSPCRDDLLPVSSDSVVTVGVNCTDSLDENSGQHDSGTDRRRRAEPLPNGAAFWSQIVRFQLSRYRKRRWLCARVMKLGFALIFSSWFVRPVHLA